MLQRNLIVKCKMNIIDCPYRDGKTRDLSAAITHELLDWRVLELVTGVEGAVKIEPEWTGRRRGRMGMPLRVKIRQDVPTLSPKGEKSLSRAQSREWGTPN